MRLILVLVSIFTPLVVYSGNRTFSPIESESVSGLKYVQIAESFLDDKLSDQYSGCFPNVIETCDSRGINGCDYFLGNKDGLCAFTATENCNEKECTFTFKEFEKFYE